ncbi:squalene synthase HpnC [Comamonas sp. GB3 AK4-5]|uniref:squalene synthase HpnC n=1 Tax=Comamonas sp. GB3 AK4-5 TaxID=3231487 RepID=UPI00351F5863
MKSTTPATATKASLSQAAPVTHYENFPVASLLCPPALRPPIAALYHFARSADDLADEGDATPSQRLADLAAYRQELHAAAAGSPPGPRWAGIFGPLQYALQQHHLPAALLDDLLSAFAQDVDFNARAASYADRDQLLDYCRRSANPVGRLLLHLYGIQDATSLQQSDAICSALQLINFWQDLSVDLPRGRHYLTDADCSRFGVQRADLLQPQTTEASRALVMDCATWARALMLQGAPLVHRLPGRAGWELRLVVQGGLRILDKVEALQGNSLLQRPTVSKADLPRMLWKALRMSPP